MTGLANFGGVCSIAVHSGSILFGHTINSLDVVACDFAPRGPHNAADEKEHVERSRFSMKDRFFDGITGEGQAAWAAFKTVDEPKIARTGIAQLVKRHWFVLKSLILFGHGRQEVIDVPINVASGSGVDIEVVLDDFVTFTIKLDRVALNSGLYERLGGSERTFVHPAQISIRPSTSAVISEGLEQAAPATSERSDGFQSERRKPAHGVHRSDQALGNTFENGDDTTVNNLVNDQNGFASVAPEFIGQGSQRCGEGGDLKGLVGAVSNNNSVGLVGHADSPINSAGNLTGPMGAINRWSIGASVALWCVIGAAWWAL